LQADINRIFVVSARSYRKRFLRYWAHLLSKNVSCEHIVWLKNVTVFNVSHTYSHNELKLLTLHILVIYIKQLSKNLS